MAVVQARALRRTYGDFVALDGVTFDIERGEIVGLLGPNGAGKSTTMKILTGYLAPTGGSATVCGHDVLDDPLSVRQQLGYLPESAPIYEDMHVVGYLDFIARVRQLGASERARAIDRVVEEVGLRDRRRQSIATLSKGYRQRVGLAQAILHEPQLVILDEPTNGLDPNQIVEIRSIIRRIGETRTVILSTHILPEVQVTCDRVLIVHKGKLVADGATDEVIGGGTGHRLSVGLAPGKVVVSDAEVLAQLGAVEGVSKVQTAAAEGEVRKFTLYAERDVRAELFHWAVAKGHVLVELAGEASNLEEVFRRLTEGAEAA